ncbi:MAG TPA: hypothetical protein VFC60_02580 [Tissierellaceae bacterium]|nr:hypothetical protein [Tissierellaceae bacterium]
MIIEKGFHNRMKKLIPIRMLGMGMDLGGLNEYSHEICFLLIQNIFKRELNENSNRTRDDMIFITEKVLKDMELEANREIVERIVDGTLWYREPSKQEAFTAEIFNEDKVSKEDYSFRYFTIDRENSLWEQGGSTVYMLSEESQEMIFITREILEEFGFDLEQFYTLQLIKTGNLSKANNSIDGLIGRVRTLINREKEYRRTIIRNPQNIIFNRSSRGERSEKEVREQFQEEQDLFQKMFSWKSRYDSLPEDKKAEAEAMFEKLQRARALHDNLAKYVIENLALEIEIRVNHPESFWRISNLSFKKDIWRENVVKNGLNKMEDLESLLSILFSPRLEFIYPLDWAWAEQKTKYRRKIKNYEEEIIEEIWDFRKTDWELIVELWEDVFISLLNKGSFSILDLNEKNKKERLKWLSQRENIDLFMMFVISPVILRKVHSGKDERLKVFQLLCEKNPDIEALEGKKIISKVENTDKKFKWKELFISPYTIYIRE